MADERVEEILSGPVYIRPARTLADVQRRARLITRMRAARQDIEQMFIDTAAWNENARKPGEAPIDPDPDGDMRRLCDYYDRLLKSETH